MKNKKPTKERTTTKTFIRLGDNNPKRTHPKPKDWAHVTPTEGRKGKATRTKKIKTHDEIWKASTLKAFLLVNNVGLPECRWLVTANSRKLTSRDTLYILAALEQSTLTEVETSINSSFRSLELSIPEDIIRTRAEGEVATPTHDS